MKPNPTKPSPTKPKSTKLKPTKLKPTKSPMAVFDAGESSVLSEHVNLLATLLGLPPLCKARVKTAVQAF